MSTNTNHSEKKITGFQLVTFVLSIYVLGALFVDTAFKLSPEVSSLLQKLDTAICVVFLWDFFYRLYRAENRLAFLKWGWIDFISSIPMLDIFRWGRLIRVIRILRILRGVRSTKVILSVLFQNRANGTFSVVALIAMILVVFSSIAILNAETGPDSNIKNAGDALWWAIATITTVGYGDKYPVSAEGRVIAAILMTAGVGLFGTFTAYVAAFFLGTGKSDERSESELSQELKLVRQQLEKIEASLNGNYVKLPAQFGPQPVSDKI
jgi:voltage-gated potassium channel